MAYSDYESSHQRLIKTSLNHSLTNVTYYFAKFSSNIRIGLFNPEKRMNKDKENTERRPTISLTRTKKSNDNLPNRESRIATTVFNATRSSGPYIIISPVTKNRYINWYFHMLIFPNFFKIKEIRKVYPTKGIRAVQTMFSSQRYVVSRVSPAACHTDKQLKQQKKGGCNNELSTQG